jgi:hypothetical protein
MRRTERHLLQALRKPFEFCISKKILRMGPQHIHSGVPTLKPKKTARSTGITIEVPAHPIFENAWQISV